MIAGFFVPGFVVNELPLQAYRFFLQISRNLERKINGCIRLH